MSPIRISPAATTEPTCVACPARGPWDVIATSAYCPKCEEELVRDETDTPLQATLQQNRCALCDALRTLPFKTQLLETGSTLEIDLCVFHLRQFLGRCLSIRDFSDLRRQIRALDESEQDVFLLHDAFYSPLGVAQRPAIEEEDDE